jgi:hypothetical protein
MNLLSLRAKTNNGLNTDKWKEPCSDCETFTEEYHCGQDGDKDNHN